MFSESLGRHSLVILSLGSIRRHNKDASRSGGVPGLSDFSLPSPFRQSPQNTDTDTHSGALHGPSSLRPQDEAAAAASAQANLWSASRGSAQLERRAPVHPTPPTPTPRSLSCPPLQAGPASRRQGTRCRRGAHRLACHKRHGRRLPTLSHVQCPVPAPQASRPAQPRAHSGRFGPARAPRKWTSGP